MPRLVRNSNQVTIDGETLRQMRDAAGWSQERLARQAGISRSYVAEIERGQRKPRMLVANAIAKSLRVDLERLLT